MKRYFSISITLFAFSALNALTYLLLGIIYGDTAFAEIFSITYPLQYVASILLYFFVSASNIRANKEGNKNCVQTGLFLGLVSATIIFVIVAVFVDKYILFMNMEPDIYRNFTLMAIGQLFFTFVINVIAEKLYFENKDRKANLCNLGFVLLNLITVVITVLITKNQLIILLVNLSSLCLYCAILLGFTFKKFKFTFNLKKNFKFASLDVINSLIMFMIYLIGYRRAFAFGAEFIAALNLVNLITDPLWDALVAINKIAKIDISQANYNYRRALRNSGIITACYGGFGIILFFSLFQVYHVVLAIGLIRLGFQIADMILEVFLSNLREYLQLEFSAKITTGLHFFVMTLRAVLTIFVISPYNTNIGQIVGDTVALGLLLIYRFKFYKVNKMGMLVRIETGQYAPLPGDAADRQPHSATPPGAGSGRDLNAFPGHYPPD